MLKINDISTDQNNNRIPVISHNTHAVDVDGIIFELPVCLTIKKSELSGNGVFALTDIAPRTLLGYYEGKRVDMTEEEADKFDSWYLMEIMNFAGERWYLDAQDPHDGNWTRFVNCATELEQENTEFVQYDGAIGIMSGDLIKKGSELLVWYGECFGPLIAGKNLHPELSRKKER